MARFIEAFFVFLALIKEGTGWAWSTSAPLNNKIHKISTQKRSMATTTETVVTSESTTSSAIESSAVRPLSKTGHDHEAWKNGYTSCREEISGAVLDFQDLPSDFPVGTYYRNGYGRFESDDGIRVRHMFDADGLLSAITFDPVNKRILFRNRFVRTAGYVNDKTTGTMSAPGVFGTKVSGGLFKNLFRTDFKVTANTNVLYSNKTLYALNEGGWPYRCDPLTLLNDYVAEPYGHDLNGLLDKGEPLSAHYRYDPEHDTYVDFGVNLKIADGASEINLYEFDANTMNPVRNDRVSAIFQGTGLIHDFALTKNWCIFSIPPASINYVRAMKGIMGLVPFASVIEFQNDAKETSIIMIPRMKDIKKGTASGMKIGEDPRIKIIKVPYHFAFHFVNAFEDADGYVNFDLLQMPFANLGTHQNDDRPVWEALDFDFDIGGNSYVRYIIDPESQKLIQPPKTILKNCGVDFPAYPRSLSTKKNRFCYLLATHNEFNPDPVTGAGTGPLGTLLKLDTSRPHNNELESFTFLPHEFINEPIFVSKVGADANKPEQEDKGYIIAQIIDGIKLTTDLVIFDVEGNGNLEKGPIARLRLPTFIPHGLHGTFVEGLAFDF